MSIFQFEFFFIISKELVENENKSAAMLAHI